MTESVNDYNPYAIGFTGSRNARPATQLDALAGLFKAACAIGYTHLHLGDCVGADHQAYNVGIDYFVMVGHPPIEDGLRAHLTYFELREPEPYLERNDAIVRDTGILVAMPDGPERRRSGTWSTIRYARQLDREGRIVWPNGVVTTLWP